jgi:hypothetical protein
MVEAFPEIKHISRDAVREKYMSGDFTMDKEQHVKGLCEHLVNLHLLGGKDVYLDSTATRLRDRQWLMHDVGNRADRKVCLYFPCPVDVSIARRPNIPEEHIKRMAANLTAEPPHRLEGFELITVVHALEDQLPC